MMLLGLANAPTTFMDLMNVAFHDYLDHFVIVFIDDILIYSMSQEKQEEHLRIVLQILRENKLFATLSKYEFQWNQIVLLGYVIAKDEITLDLGRI